MTVEDLYRKLIDAWNARDAQAFEDLFVLDGDCVGFDGTQKLGRGEIGEHLRKIFGEHPTPKYVAKITGVAQVTTDVVILRAIAGMVPPGASDLDPQLNAIHRLTAVQRKDAWWIALFQNTPARFDRRPQDVEQMTAELRAEIRR